MLAHEFGHHLQATAGMFDDYSTRYFEGSRSQRAELRRWHSFTGDEDPPASRRPDHGTSRAQVGWLERGLDSGDLGRCNTRPADSSAVR